jgi:hypothetical protein
MSPITGAEIVVMRRRIAAMNIKVTPIQWTPRNMLAIAVLLLRIGLRLVVDVWAFREGKLKAGKLLG